MDWYSLSKLLKLDIIFFLSSLWSLLFYLFFSLNSKLLISFARVTMMPIKPFGFCCWYLVPGTWYVIILFVILWVLDLIFSINGVQHLQMHHELICYFHVNNFHSWLMPFALILPFHFFCVCLPKGHWLTDPFAGSTGDKRFAHGSFAWYWCLGTCILPAGKCWPFYWYAS